MSLDFLPSVLKEYGRCVERKIGTVDLFWPLFSLISHQDFDIHTIYLPLFIYLSLYLSSHYLSIYHLLIILALCSSQKFILFLCKGCSLTLHLILHIFAPYTQSANVLRKHTHTHTQLTEECCLLMTLSALLSVVVAFSFLEHQLPQQLTFSFQKICF